LNTNHIYYKKAASGRVGGFTLIELIFVTAILVFITALAVPRFSGSFKFLAARNFVFDAASFARYAQAAAITDAAVYRLVLDPGKKILKIESYAGTGLDDEELTEIWRLEKSKLMPDSVSIDLNSVENKIKFYPDGTADEAVISITASGGKSYTLSVKGVTGYVRLEEDKDE
jgi:type II secretory pathway pseudopilin PulG